MNGRPHVRADAGLARTREAPPRLALRLPEAAACLGMSEDSFERHVLPTLRVVYAGRIRLFPVRELERWLERQAVAPVSDTGAGS